MLITPNIIVAVAPEANLELVSSLIAPLNTYLPQYKIDTLERVSMFLAQWCEETDGFKVMYEYASGREYEGRKDLGNVQPGDGPRFKGRGIAMLTGRDNYAAYGSLLGVDLLSDPERAAEPDIAVRIACLFWQKHNINAWADRGDVKHCTYLINGGTNGLAVREANYQAFYLELHQARPAPIPMPPRTENTPDPVPVPVPIPSHEPSTGPIAINPTPPVWRTPEGSMFGTALASQIGMIFSGATGPIAWALTFVIVVAVVVGLVYLWKRLHRGQ